jgi:hypothetical protein
MKRPIELDAILAGDLIRYESGEIAHEWRAQNKGHGFHARAGQHYLLDRPEPAVELPTEPTLGTVTWKYHDSAHVQQETALWNPTPDGLCFRSESSSIPVAFVIDFTPIRTLADDATAVPTKALDELRGSWGGCERSIGKFLAVDAAGDRA